MFCRNEILQYPSTSTQQLITQKPGAVLEFCTGVGGSRLQEIKWSHNYNHTILVIKLWPHNFDHITQQINMKNTQETPLITQWVWSAVSRMLPEAILVTEVMLIAQYVWDRGQLYRQLAGRKAVLRVVQDSTVATMCIMYS